MEMQLRINEYWSKRSDEFADARYQDLHSQKNILKNDTLINRIKLGIEQIGFVPIFLQYSYKLGAESAFWLG